MERQFYIIHFKKLLDGGSSDYYFYVKGITPIFSGINNSFMILMDPMGQEFRLGR